MMKIINLSLLKMLISINCHLLSLKYERTDKGSHDNQTEQSDCNKQLIASFFKMTKMLFCPFEDENKNCIKWCYPPSFAKNLTLPRSYRITDSGDSWKCLSSFPLTSLKIS